MLKIIEIKDIDDCLDNTVVKDILFDKSITKDFIFFIGNMGDLEYYDSFARPYFNLNIENKFTIKGVEGNKTIRVITKGNIENILLKIKDKISEYK